MTFFEWAMAATPTPDPNFDPNSVTPQWIGFLATFLVAVATLLLIVDMTRRIRRVRYRDEIRANLEAERAAADLGVVDDGAAGPGAPDLGAGDFGAGDFDAGDGSPAPGGTDDNPGDTGSAS
jgi:hypothetical protein